MKLTKVVLVGVFLFCGSFFLPQALSGFLPDTTATITVDPIDTLVVLGDSLDFEAYVTNHTGDTLVVDVWFTATPDTGGNEVLIPPIALCIPNNPQEVKLDPYETRGGACWQWVPAWQDPGGYTLTGKVGYYVNIDSLVIDEDSFHFWVVESEFLLFYNQQH